MKSSYSSLTHHQKPPRLNTFEGGRGLKVNQKPNFCTWSDSVPTVNSVIDCYGQQWGRLPICTTHFWSSRIQLIYDGDVFLGKTRYCCVTRIVLGAFRDNFHCWATKMVSIVVAHLLNGMLLMIWLERHNIIMMLFEKLFIINAVDFRFSESTSGLSRNSTF